MIRFPSVILCVVVLALAACNADKLQPESEAGPWPSPEGAAARLTGEEYSALPPLEQFHVANKLAGTLYKGVPAAQFFDLSAGVENLQVEGGANYVNKTAGQLGQRLKNPTSYVERYKARYTFDPNRRASAAPLAAIFEYPLSREQFDAWVAYNLANTILFSPAEEIDSASYVDVDNVYSGLIKTLGENATIREIVFAHMTSEANWRRFRSPEDNTREMIEIYLGLFDRDADVPRAAIACKNWYITDADKGYQLVRETVEENRVPQKVLDQWVTSCEDFFRLVAAHPLLIPRMTTVLVDHFFPNYGAEQRAAMVQSIAATQPERFQDIFAAIILSREYLLNNERPQSLEETLFGVAGRVQWAPTAGFFSDLTNPDRGKLMTLHQMNQPAMSLKLGRWKDQPLDSLSFAHYHRAVRELVLVDRRDNALDRRDGGWSPEIIRAGDFLSKKDFIQYLFISVLARKPSDQELTALTEIITLKAEIKGDAKIDPKPEFAALIVFDYISRLPELYYLTAH